MEKTYDNTGDIKLGEEYHHSSTVDDDWQEQKMPNCAKLKIMKVPMKNVKDTGDRNKSEDENKRWDQSEEI
jgi:NADH:ubiquinone oxidoreductase subunit